MDVMILHNVVDVALDPMVIVQFVYYLDYNYDDHLDGHIFVVLVVRIPVGQMFLQPMMSLTMTTRIGLFLNTVVALINWLRLLLLSSVLPK